MKKVHYIKRGEIKKEHTVQKGQERERLVESIAMATYASVDEMASPSCPTFSVVFTYLLSQRKRR
jgi:hypothetical protein